LSHSSGETDLLVCLIDLGANTNAHANSATQTANNFHGSSQAIGFKELGIECSMLIVPAVIQRFTILILIIYIVIFYMSRNFQLIFDLENTDHMGGQI
jgi:hypothetical protein